MTYKTRKRCPMRARNTRTLENDVPDPTIRLEASKNSEVTPAGSGIPNPFGLVSMQILKNTRIWRAQLVNITYGKGRKLIDFVNILITVVAY